MPHVFSEKINRVAHFRDGNIFPWRMEVREKGKRDGFHAKWRAGSFPTASRIGGHERNLKAAFSRFRHFLGLK
jgi:hypothetical protein